MKVERSAGGVPEVAGLIAQTIFRNASHVVSSLVTFTSVMTIVVLNIPMCWKNFHTSFADFALAFSSAIHKGTDILTRCTQRLWTSSAKER